MKISVSETHKVRIFQKGLVNSFGQKFEILLTIFFCCKIHREKVFGDVLVRTQAFLENINMDLKRRQNWHFCMILVKKLKFFHLLCFSKIDREIVFADVLDKKEAFKDYKNNCVRKT